MKKTNVLLTAIAVVVCSSAAVRAEDLVFKLTNGTNSVLNNFHASPVGVEQWEDDIFGQQVLAPGESMQITIADGRRTCKYDLKFDFEGSDKLETTTDTQDLCEMSTYTLTE